MITQSQLKELLHYNSDLGVFTWIKKPNPRANRIKIGSAAGWIQNGYLMIGLFGKNYLAHRLAWLYEYNEMPKEIDHININKLDNRICNLRKVTHQQNCFNFPLNKSNTTGYTGVSFSKKLKKYRAYIKINYKQKYLGVFKNIEDAVLAVKLAKEKYHVI